MIYLSTFQDLSLLYKLSSGCKLYYMQFFLIQSIEEDFELLTRVKLVGITKQFLYLYKFIFCSVGFTAEH